MRNPSTCDCQCTQTCKIDKYLDTKSCSCGKRVLGKLKLVYKDEI